ncbi:hypothetical protein RclHR1_02750009 [Rhizophagus clarus]|uniref:HCP-like protein n=1 Tax=Rhizophagus clarus TaxID=94130 RepID=A0A2Z6R1Y5_9GLOM|nr:hypothetical protein RclHR1_02750009 [Rhizophagus clarus]
MQDHLDKKKCQELNNTGSQSRQQNIIDNSDNRLCEEEQKSLEYLLSKEFVILDIVISTELKLKEMKTKHSNCMKKQLKEDILIQCIILGNVILMDWELFENATEKGHLDSIYQLGQCYYRGVGTEANEIKAFELYKEAAEKGHLDSMYHLGQYYENGKGTIKNMTKAFELCKKAAKKGQYNSMLELAVRYYYGM